MTWIDKPVTLALLAIDVIAILIGMVTGPLGYLEISIACSVAAVIISGAIVAFALFSWNKNKK